MANGFPCDINGSRAPAMYTYYAIMSLLVIFLAVTLMWIPFLQLITEFSTLVSKSIIFLSANLYDEDDDCFIDCLASILVNEKFLLSISIITMGFLIFLASGDFLIFLACYVNNLPDQAGFVTLSKCVMFLTREEIERDNEGTSVPQDQNLQNKNLLAL